MNCIGKKGSNMFNKSYIKKGCSDSKAVILAATALPVNMANADTQTTGSTVTGSTLTGITANQAASEYTEIRTASELVEAKQRQPQVIIS